MTQPTIEQMIERTVGQDLWSLVRSVMCQGISINDDYHHGKRFASYEEYSARIDEAARERAEGLLAVICTALTAQAGDGNRLPLEEIPAGYSFCEMRRSFNVEGGFNVRLISLTRDEYGLGKTPAEALRAAIASATAVNNSAEN